MRLAAFGKLCAGFDTTYGTRGEAGMATDQVTADIIRCSLRIDAVQHAAECCARLWAD